MDPKRLKAIHELVESKKLAIKDLELRKKQIDDSITHHISWIQGVEYVLSSIEEPSQKLIQAIQKLPIPSGGADSHEYETKIGGPKK